MKFIIDQANADHEAELEWSNTVESIPVTFMPSATASQEIKTNGIKVMYTFETSGTWDFDGAGGEDAKALYSVATGKYKVELTALGRDVNGDGINDFQGTIPASVFVDAITLNGTLVLDTKSDYDTFSTALANLKVGITVAHDVNDEGLPYTYTTQP